jgi:hypothetical protein
VGFGNGEKYISRAKKAPIPTTIPYPTPFERTRIPSVVAILLAGWSTMCLEQWYKVVARNN